MKTYNVELTFQDSQDHDFWVKTLERQRKIFNELSPIVFNLPQRNSLKLNHDAVYHIAKQNHPDFPSQFLIKTEQELTANYKTILTNKHKIVKPVEKKNLSLRLDKNCSSKFTDKSIFLISSKQYHRVEAKLKLYPQIEELFQKYKSLDPLIFARNGRLFLSITFDIPEPKAPDSSVLGIDLGMRRLFVTSEGKALSGKEYLKHKQRIRYNKRMLQKANSKSSKKHLKKERRYESNFSKNYVHHVANEILNTSKSIIVLEDLTNIKQSTKTHANGQLRTSHNNRMSQVPFFLLKQTLTYKALHKGKCVETVNPAFTSQKDYRGKASGVRQGCRYYAKDKLVFDADWNASINIAQKFSKHPESLIHPSDGKLSFLGKLLSTS